MQLQSGTCRFKAAHAGLTPAQYSTSQRRQLTASEMQHKSAKAAQFQVSESISSRRMQLQGDTCSFKAANASFTPVSMQHKSAKEAHRQRNAAQARESNSISSNSSQRMHFKTANVAFKAAHAG
jgi:hypothetical protein